MAQCERAYQLLLGVLVLHRIYSHGVCGAYALVSRARVAHHRNHGSAHSGVACRRRLRQYVREYAVAEDAVTQRTVYCLAQTMSEVAFDRLFGSLQVILSCLQYESYLVHRSGCGEVVYGAHAEFRIAVVAVLAAGVLHVEERLSVFGYVDEVGVRARYHRLRLMTCRLAYYVDVKLFGDVRLQSYVYPFLLYISLALLECLRRHVLYHLQLILRPAHDGSQSYSYGQTNHSRARYTYAHGVLQYVRAQHHRYLLRSLSERLGGACGAESHGDRLRTAHCRHHLALYQCYDALSYVLV